MLPRYPKCHFYSLLESLLFASYIYVKASIVWNNLSTYVSVFNLKKKLPGRKTPCTPPWQQCEFSKTSFPSLVQEHTLVPVVARESNISQYCTVLSTSFIWEPHTYIFTILSKLNFSTTSYWFAREVSDLKIHFVPVWMRWMAD